MTMETQMNEIQNTKYDNISDTSNDLLSRLVSHVW